MSSHGSPSDILGVLREVAEHSLRITANSKLVKQCLRRFDDKKRRAIEEEVAKLLAVGFVMEVLHPD